MCNKAFKAHKVRKDLMRSVYSRKDKGASICGANLRACD